MLAGTGELFEAPRVERVDEGSGGEEEEGLGHRVVQHVQDAPDEAELVSEGDAEDDVTYVGDAAEGQQPLDVV
jgi:hypothetical protein